MKIDKQIGWFRWLSYLFIWAVLFLVPVITPSREVGSGWNQAISEWIRLLPFLIVFFIHHFGILPLLENRKRRSLYLILTLTLVVVVAILSPSIRFLNDWIIQVNPPNNPPMDRFGPEEFFPGDHPREFRPGQRPSPQGGPTGSGPVRVLYNFIIAILVVGFDAALTLVTKWLSQEQKTREIEKGQLQTELAFLRTQVSPHFFMNTLNNIHALIEQDQPKAQDAVIRLSNMMRYLLYESRNRVPLAKEIEFLKSYFDLMRLRYDEKVKINALFPSNAVGFKIPPLLSISLIENAFKHGISYENDSFVKFDMTTKEKWLEIKIANSTFSEQVTNPPIHQSTSHGIGLENLKKQLTMLFDKDYQLTIREEGNAFIVYMKIPLDHD